MDVLLILLRLQIILIRENIIHMKKKEYYTHVVDPNNLSRYLLRASLIQKNRNRCKTPQLPWEINNAPQLIGDGPRAART